MTHLLPTQAPRRIGGDGFWRKTWAVLVKEFIQLKRDRVSFAMIIMIPLIQLMLFGYAINTNPRHLPTAVLLQEHSDLGRSILAAIKNTDYFDVTQRPNSEAELDELLASGKILFGIEIPRGFERAVRRGDDPAMLVVADATDPIAASSAVGALSHVMQTALVHDRAIPVVPALPFEIRIHQRYNPAGLTQLNIVPGLVGTILTMTMLIFTALSVTREIERGTMENLLSMPITPVEIMLGKIVPYIMVGFMQATMIIGTGVLLFGVPILGSLFVLAALSTLFIATNLSIGYTFSTIAQNQLQADADVADVLSAEHSAVGIHVSLCRHAELGAMGRRGVAAHALSAHRARDHAEGLFRRAICIMTRRRCCADAGRHDHRGDALPPHAGLIGGSLTFSATDQAGHKGWRGGRCRRPSLAPPTIRHCRSSCW